MNKITSIFFILIFIFAIFSCTLSENSEELNTEFLNSSFHYNENSMFSWPLFGYYNISSKFGYRKSPTNGASTYHSGIDIPAPPRYKYIFNM